MLNVLPLKSTKGPDVYHKVLSNALEELFMNMKYPQSLHKLFEIDSKQSRFLKNVTEKSQNLLLHILLHFVSNCLLSWAHCIAISLLFGMNCNAMSLLFVLIWAGNLKQNECKQMMSSRIHIWPFSFGKCKNCKNPVFRGKPPNLEIFGFFRFYIIKCCFKTFKTIQMS